MEGFVSRGLLVHSAWAEPPLLCVLKGAQESEQHTELFKTHATAQIHGDRSRFVKDFLNNELVGWCSVILDN